ncbi:MAG: prepilin-type N-terminal cleavage/methylation domain-containing protein [Syntrophaceae bacterium]|nr:prepilin-type N-terminal cleavage/methylation domain-containing protein [Syntrophaceae bacterium]
MKLKPTKGFSIVELLTVIAIIGIVAVIAIPAFKAFNDNRNLKEVAGQIASDMQYYKHKSIAENTRYLLAYNHSLNRLYTYKRACSDPCSVNYCLTFLGYKAISPNYSSIKIDGAPYFNNSSTACNSGVMLHFSSRGLSGSGSLTIKHTRGSTATISISPIGKVNVTYDLK